MMSSTNEGDPFLQVQHDVLSQLAAARPLFSSYLRIRSLTTTASSPELASARSELEAALTGLSEDLADLVASVQAVESNPASFGLDAHEVNRRKRLLQEVGGEVEDMREEVSKALNASASGKGRAAGGPAGADLPDPNAFELSDRNEDNYAQFEQQQQLAIMREQDEELDEVFQTVGNLRRQADDMGREMEEQTEMLEHMDNLADRVGGRLQTGMQKLNYVIRNNEDRWSSWCIALLIFVLIVLLVLLLML